MNNRQVYILLSALAVTLLLIVFDLKPVLDLSRLIFHDNWAGWGLFHVSNEILFSGAIPGWDHATNNGQPLWPSTELPGHSFDPIPIVIWASCKWLDLGTLFAYQLTLVTWLLVFGVGGAMLMSHLTRNPLVCVSVFLLLVLGPLQLTVLGQAAFIVIFRYLPWIIFALVKTVEKPKWSSALLLGLFSLIGSDGYQTGYIFIAIMAFSVPYICTLAKAGWRPERRHYRSLFLVLALSVSGVLPVVSAALDTRELAIVNRVAVPIGYVMDAKQLVTGLLMGFDRYFYCSTSIGPTAFLLAAFAIASLVHNFRPIAGESVSLNLPNKRRAMTAAIVGLTSCTLVSGILACDGFGILSLLRGSNSAGDTWLGLRNWGFMTAPFLFGLIALAGCGVNILGQAEITKTLTLILKAIIVLFFLVWLMISSNIGASFATAWLNHSVCLYSPEYCTSGGTVRSLPLLIWAALGSLPFISILLVQKYRPYSIALLVRHFGAEYRTEIVSLILFFSTFAHVLQISTAIRPNVAPGSLEILKRQPPMNHPDFPVLQRRNAEFDAARHAPFYFYGPFLWREPTAFVTAYIGGATGVKYANVLYVFALKRYQAVIDSIPPGSKRNVLLSVDANIARLVNVECGYRSTEDAIQRLQNMTTEQLRTTAVLETGVGELPNCASRSDEAPGSAAVVAVGDEMKIQVSANTDAVLLISEGFTNNWRGEVNGTARDIYPANGFAMALRVPAGPSIVILRYENAIYKALYLWRILVLFVIFFVLLGCYITNYRKNRIAARTSLAGHHATDRDLNTSSTAT